MKQVSKKSIDEFLQQKSFAFVGVSRKEKGFPNLLYAELKKKNFHLMPVNPNMQEFMGKKCYPEIALIEEKVDAAILTTPKKETLKVLKQVYEKGIKNVWIQQGAHSEEAIEFAESTDMNVIANKCLFMFANPIKGGHKFHRVINKIFGALPK